MIEVDFKIENEERVESVFNVENDDDMNFSAEMGDGVSKHDKLKNRDLPNQHPMSAITGLETALNGKQPVIPDLEEIRQGAEKGKNALPSTTKYGSSLSLTINDQTYILTAQLKDQNGDNLGTAQMVDLPLETMVVGAEYDENTKELVLTLKNGETVRFSIADLVSGLQPTIPDLAEIRDGARKGETAVQPDELNDYATTQALTEGLATKQPIGDYATKQELNAKQDTIQDLSAIRTGAEKGNTAVQPNQLSAVATSGNYNDLSNKPTIPTQTSQLTNNSDFTTKTYVDGLVGDIETLLNNINSGG